MAPRREGAVPDGEVLGNAFKDTALFKWVDAEARTIPGTTKGGAPQHKLDPIRWSNFVRFAPNVTIDNVDNGKRGEVEVRDAFYMMNTIVVFLVFEVFFQRILPRMVCPACGKSDNVVQSGWTGLRRCASHSSNVVLYGRQYRCVGCSKATAPGGSTCFNCYDSDVIRALPIAIQLQLPFVLTHRGAMWRSDVDLLERPGLNIADFVDGLEEVRARRFDHPHPTI